MKLRIVCKCRFPNVYSINNVFAYYTVSNGNQRQYPFKIMFAAVKFIFF